MVVFVGDFGADFGFFLRSKFKSFWFCVFDTAVPNLKLVFIISEQARRSSRQSENRIFPHYSLIFKQVTGCSILTMIVK